MKRVKMPKNNYYYFKKLVKQYCCEEAYSFFDERYGELIYWDFQHGCYIDIEAINEIFQSPMHTKFVTDYYNTELKYFKAEMFREFERNMLPEDIEGTYGLTLEDARAWYQEYIDRENCRALGLPYCKGVKINWCL